MEHASVIDFTTREEGWGWIDRQPITVAAVIATRMALRVLPLMFVYQRSRPARTFFNNKALPSFRAVAVSWTAAKFSTHREELRDAAAIAALNVRTAYYESGFTNDAAFLAAYNAAVCVAGDPALRLGDYKRENFPVPIDGYTAANQASNAEVSALEAEAAGDRGSLAQSMIDAPLWSGALPSSVTWTWGRMKETLFAADEGWEIWVHWYEDRLLGRPSLGEAFDIAVATLPSFLWEQGPRAVNDRIRKLIEEYTPAEPIPAQQSGPHFILSPDLKIALAPPRDIDAEGNNVDRIRQFLPLVRQAAADLAGHLNPNIHPELARNLAQYRSAIGAEGEAVAWGTMFGLGVRLDNAAVAARREIADRMQEPLEDAAKEALDSLLTLHGPLILATAEGRELMAEADRNELTLEQQRDLRDDARTIAGRLKTATDIIEPVAASVIETATETIGEGRHPERATAYGVAAVKNVATIAIPTAVLAGAAWWIGDFAGGVVAGIGALPLGHSRRIRAALSALKLDYDRLFEVDPDAAIARLRRFAPFREFIVANEEPLRRIAQNSTQLHWMLGYIDFIVRTKGYENRANGLD